MRQFLIDYFFNFFEADFFLNCFSDLFIVHFRPSFFKTKFPFLTSCFIHMWHFDIDFLFFMFFN